MATKLPRKVHTPMILQLESVECGAAALAIILAYHKTYISLPELRIACGVSRDGSRANNIMKASRIYGLDPHAFRLELDDVRNFKPPFIAFWGFNHFLVVEGFSKNQVFLNDPAVGHRTISMEEFAEKFTGIVMSFDKTPGYKPKGHKPSFIPALIKRLRHQKLALSFLIFTGIGLIIPGVLLPAFTKVFIDGYLVSHMTKWLLPLLCGLLIIAVIKGVLAYLQEYFLLRLRMKLSLTSSSQFLWHVLHLPMIFFSQRGTGDIAQRMEINDRVANLLSNQLIATVLNLITVAFFVILMFIYSIPLTIVCVVIALLNLLVLRLASRYQINISKNISLDWGKLFSITMGGIAMIETYKATGAEGNLFSRWSGQFTKVLNAQQKSGVITQILVCLSFLLTNLNTIVVLGVGGYFISHGNMSVGTLVAFQSLLLSFSEPFGQLISSGSILHQMHGDMNRLDDVLNYPSLPVSPKFEHGHKTKLRGSLVLKNLSFGYNKYDPPLINDFSLTIQPGQRIAIMGSSSSGRSTIAKLILGLYTPWSGEIILDNMPRDSINSAIFSNSVAYVSQDIRLFEGSLRDNLTLWDTTISDIDILKATKDAVIHGVISGRKGGYDSIVLEAGRNFSGGECQRIEIARALSTNPSLLILDEATSALDSVVEEQVIANIKQRECACLIIAHRLSSIRDCDEILVLDKGQIIQRGTHVELIKDINGLYYQLVNLTQDQE